MIALALDDLAFAIVLGSALGGGMCLVLSRAPRWRAPSLARRIAPYIRDVTDPRGTGFAPVSPPHDLTLTWRAAQRRFAFEVDPFFHARHFHAELRTAYGCDIAGGAAADDDHIKCSGHNSPRMSMNSRFCVNCDDAEADETQA